MRLERGSLEEFQALYKKHFGIDLDTKEAAELGSQLVRLFNALARAYTQSGEHTKNE